MQIAVKTKAGSVYVSAKVQAAALLDRIPDNASFKEIQYELYVLSAIDEGMRDIDAGRVVSHEEVGKLMAEWFKK